MDGLWVWPGHMVHIISTEKGVFLVGNDAWLFEVNGKENLNGLIEILLDTHDMDCYR